jgi:hypothetical protein
MDWYLDQEGLQKPSAETDGSKEWQDPRGKRGVQADYERRCEADGPQTDNAREVAMAKYWASIGKERP